ncbi:sirohydrochlorin chelatase [Undibacterium baiyunense]|uniref:CbiX/SirB N-terminal domain-containing protein n=1 Tax=Undibacterium baiyunense TaxID=2828731 RepID=A0A941DFC8_9BURK|nr:CbiX/SirB N-terminal domain-containing protein [Undibacterium baiyunense]MBR7746613.1 CbiX/SirB N-terminal domain-containing protein [Undibacterium baiyunense]
MKKQALILFAHGARAASWAEPFLRLQKLTQESEPELRVELAFLELMQPQLPEVVKKLVDLSYESVTIAPIFLGQGGHLLRDLPLMVEEIRQQYPALQIQQVAAAGEDAGVLQAIRDYCLRAVAVNP